jgi:hypothetical protein
VLLSAERPVARPEKKIQRVERALSIGALLERRHGEGNHAHPTETHMAHTPRKSTWNEQLWNISLLPLAATPCPVTVASGPTPHDRGQALRSAALLSLVETEASRRLPRAA